MCTLLTCIFPDVREVTKTSRVEECRLPRFWDSWLRKYWPKKVDSIIVWLFVWLQRPDASENGYAFYHRVDKVNGGDSNPTHTSGFGKSTKFWYKWSSLILPNQIFASLILPLIQRCFPQVRLRRGWVNFLWLVMCKMQTFAIIEVLAKLFTSKFRCWRFSIISVVCR